MRVLGFSGCSTAEGTSAQAARRILALLEQGGHATELVLVGNSTILPCTGCDACLEKGVCTLADSVNGWVDRMEQADGILFTAPVRAGGLATPLKILLERAAQMGRGRADFLARTIGGLSVTEGRVGGMQALFEIINFYWSTHAIVTWAGYWPFVTGNKDISGDAEGLSTLDDIASQMNWALHRPACPRV